MKRRSFLRTLLEVAGLLALPSPPALARPRPILLQTSPVAGFQYHDGETVWPLLRAGDPLALIREPDNPHDPKAVRVEWKGQKLGYVPRAENHAVAQLLDWNERLESRIARLHESPDPWKRIELAVEMIF